MSEPPPKQLQLQQQQPAATPTYILRGHAAPIHALNLFNQNLRLISADANGWIVVWDMVTKRPVAVWKAHDGAVLEVKGFSRKSSAGDGVEVFTHGRDHKLRMWRFRVQDEELLDKTLPVDMDEASQSNSQPWLVHSLPVNALNFCAFSMLVPGDCSHVEGSHEPQAEMEKNSVTQATLIAVPNALDSGAIDLFRLPLERRVCTIPADTATKTGMVMAVRLFISPSGHLHVASAYEDGHVMLFVRHGRLKESDLPNNNTTWKWEKVYTSRLHTQPALSIDVAPSQDYFLSSSADALLIKHPIPNTGPSGSILGGQVEESPLKTANTKHAGQQGLRIRSDGRVFATAGWDCRIRVYSCKTMKELAVLKWHEEGCYAVGFAEIITSGSDSTSQTPSMSTKGGGSVGGENPGALQLTGASEGTYSLAAVHHQRNQKVQRTHWLAAGSKDGKISLWDIY